MHQEILTKNQVELLPLLKDFSADYILVGGTAVALHIGHRHSIDFDLFSPKKIKRQSIKNYLVKKKYFVNKLIKEEEDQIHFIINNVKITFFQYPFIINELADFNRIIKIPSLLNLAAMKAFALGGRAKWKDYVDLYFIIKNHLPLKTVIQRAGKIFGEVFNGKLFLEQLSYFEDINYEEEVMYLNQPVDKIVIKEFLIREATDGL